jgi:hypothetical protein
MGAASLAGCAGSPAPPPAPPAEEKPAQAGLVSTSQASNVSAQQDDQSEFARSLDEKFHSHDYWGGARQKVLLDADIASGPVLRQNQFGVLGAVFENAFFLAFTRGVGFTPIELPEGSIVPPEADRVEAEVAWAESPTISGLAFAYRTALPDSFNNTGPLPKGGGTVAIATNLTTNDIPHTTFSKWRFYLLPHDENGLPGVFNGTAHVKVTAFRNDTLFVAPPHHDFWRANTTLLLGHNTSAIKGQRAVVPVGTFLVADGLGPGDGPDDSGFVFIELANGTIVPPHTATLALTLTWENHAAVPDVTDIRPDIIYFASNSGQPLVPSPPAREPGKAAYVVPVSPRQADSPYAAESGWGFLVYLRSDSPVDQGFGVGSAGVFDGTFTLTIEAERDSL